MRSSNTNIRNSLQSVPVVTHGIRVQDIPYVPPSFDIKHLQETGRVLTDEQYDDLKELTSKLTTGKHTVKLDHSEIDICVLEKNNKKIYLVLDKVIGKGGFGEVRIAQDQESKKFCVVKFQKKSSASIAESQVLQIENEHLGDFIQKTESHNEHVIAMEMASGQELYRFIGDPENTLSTYQWLNVLTNMAKELKQLHDKGVVHCDIKAQNFMIDKVTGNVKLIDKGLCLPMGTEMSVRGSRDVIAPELKTEDIKPLKEQKKTRYDEKIDLYPLGLSMALCVGLATYEQAPKEVLETIDVNSRKFYEIEAYLQSQDYQTAKIKIPDAALREQLLMHFKNMTTADPSERESLGDTIRALDILKFQNLQTPTSTITTGIVDISQFSDTDEEDLLDMIGPSKLLKDIILVDSSHSENSDEIFMKCRQFLEKHGIHVHEKSYKNTSNTNFIDNVVRILDNDPAILPRSYFYIDMSSRVKLDNDRICILNDIGGNQKNLVDSHSKETLSKIEVLHQVKNALLTEVQRLEKEKDSPERKNKINLIHDAIKQLMNESNTLSRSDVQNLLSTLTSNSAIIRTNTAASIQKIVEAITPTSQRKDSFEIASKTRSQVASDNSSSQEPITPTSGRYSR